jgi:CspA family cold shock protein
LRQASGSWWWVSARKRTEFRTDVRKGAETMATGTIKRLVRERGFGFIQGQDGIELFFHRSALQADEFDTLAEGQAVEFDVQRGDKGPRAANMKVGRPSA